MASALLEIVLVAAILLVGVLTVAQPLAGPAGLGLGSGRVFGEFPSVDANIDASRVRIETEPDLPALALQGEILPGDGIEMTMPTGTTVTVYEPDWPQRLGLLGFEVLGGLVTIAVLTLLLGLVRSLRLGDPFVATNARRLYAMAIAIGIGGQATVLLGAWGRAQVLGHPLVEPYLSADPYVPTDSYLAFMPLIAGLGIAVAAEVFRQGTVLRKEVEGLV